jgi:endonuclease-3
MMRASKDAPVDTMGCHMLAQPGAAPKVQRFQTLVALLLSSQTKDEVTAAAVRRLQKLPLTIDTILTTNEATLAQLICPVGFYRRKASSLLKVSTILKECYDSDIPKTVGELQKLPGIGPKMATLIMQNAWQQNVGIGVDVHVHRIANRLNWVKTTTPEATKRELEDWLPKHLWTEINPLLVGFGQTMCLPIRPKCYDCSLKDTCPSAQLGTKRRKTH